MKAKTFENLIRKIVREEIDYALRREIKSLKEDLRDEFKPTITEEVIKNPENSEIPENLKTSLKEKIMGTPPIKKQTKKDFTKDSTLNELLNETAMSPDPEETFAVNDPVNQFINKDYGHLMEAINKKNTHFRP